MLWLRTTGLGNLSKTEEKATALQDQGTRGTELSVSCSLATHFPGNDHSAARMEGSREVMSTGNKGNTPVTTSHTSSLRPVSLRQQEG